MTVVPVLELRSIVKSFGSVQALRGADFVLAPGEVHALLGENGAGKSTLLHVAFGMIRPDGGTILVKGMELAPHSPATARAMGLGMVHQHFTSIGSLTVAENIALSVGRTVGLRDRWTESLMQGLDPKVRVETLSVALRQRLEIVKALASGARTLLLDEPSAVLAPSEVGELLTLVKQFTREGGAVALVTHKLREVLAAVDRVTVLRDGRVTLNAPVTDQTATSLAEAMLGESAVREEDNAAPGSAAAAGGSVALASIGGIVIHAGEIIGVAAIEGNGQRAILRKLAGIEEPGARTTAVSVSGSVGFVPEDRSSEGLIPEMSLTENVVLGLPGDIRWTRGAQLDWRAARAHTARLIESFGIRASGPDDPAGTLSGGNQQKLILARVLDSGPSILVAENPTRGLDFRATEQVHERLRHAAQTGIAVIVYSTDLDEVLELSERVLVVHAGKVQEAPRSAERRVVGEMMLGLPAA